MPKLQAPPSGVTIRMYRQGHGDCFLLAFPRRGGGTVYVLIDCGYKPGSEDFLHRRPIDDTVAQLREATGDRIDLAIMTHEHQDHLNGVWKKNNPYFQPFTINEAWLAWTENPHDALANTLRQNHHDTLLSLVHARRQLALAVGDADPVVRRLDALLQLELGGAAGSFSMSQMLAAAEDPTKSTNKQALKLIKDKAATRRGVKYLMPGGRRAVPGSDGVRAFILGPPYNATLIADEDPRPNEAFPDDPQHPFTFAAAVNRGDGSHVTPFSPRFVVPWKQGFKKPETFFEEHYGHGKASDGNDQAEVANNAPWRRIDSDWLFSAENLALKLNTGINNTSLVVAFELPQSKKVLFFAADAQRGNWFSWAPLTWKDGDETITTRDLMARAVFYKVGHHGSHNATLHGTPADPHANLSWMGTGAFADEFTAMITAVNEWAMTKNDPPWRHPLQSIREALLAKAQGRVFQTDIDAPTKPAAVSQGTWDKFLQSSAFDELYFDFTILDE